MSVLVPPSILHPKQMHQPLTLVPALGLKSWLRVPDLQSRWLCFSANLLSLVLYFGEREPTGFIAFL